MLWTLLKRSMKTMVDCHISAISTFEQIDLEENQSPTQSPQAEVPVLVGVVGWGDWWGFFKASFYYSKSLSPYLRNTFYESEGEGEGDAAVFWPRIPYSGVEDCYNFFTL